MKQHRGRINIGGKKLQQITIDPQFGCFYLQFSNEKVTKTIEHAPSIHIDLDRAGELVGIEFVGVKKASGNFKKIFLELAKTYNRPELKKIPAELKEDLAIV